MSGMTIQIRLMGELAVFRKGEPVALPQSRKTRALLAYLVLGKGPHRRERLCELFWQIPDDPRAALRWSLSKLRNIVDEDGLARIKADREHVSFNHADARVDLLDAFAAIDGGLDGLDTDELRKLADRLSGDFLEGLELSGQPEFQTWRLAEQERGRKARSIILRALIDRLDDDPGSQAERLQELVRIEPYDPGVHCRVIRTLVRSGRRKEAEHQKSVSKKNLSGIDGFNPSLLDDALKAGPCVPVVPETGSSTPSFHQEIRFCKAGDGTQIAYATVGRGRPLVKAANWLNHLEFDWESPVWRHVFRNLTERNRLIRYDARGNGLSDWNVPDFSFNAMVSDLEAVVDAVKAERFALMGISQGCAVCVEYAARHPDKVSKLILIGGYARGWKCRGRPEQAEQTQAMLTLMRTGWGQDNPAFRQLFTSLFMPDAPIENHHWFNELQKMTTSPENAVRLLRTCGEVNVRARLADVKAPTLVIHARGDLRVPYDDGRELAAGISNARFVSLDTNNHLLPESDPAWPRFISEIETFLG